MKRMELVELIGFGGTRESLHVFSGLHGELGFVVSMSSMV